MHLERLIIKNYRSIESLDLIFTKGKNVIVGRNNAGKSNIIKALDVVLGESSPDYKKFENISLGDFHCKKTAGLDQRAEEIKILCILKRDTDEDLNFEEINKCFGYYKVLERSDYKKGHLGDEEKRLKICFEKATLDSAFKEIFLPDKEDHDESSPSYIKAKRWVDGKLINQVQFKDELSNKYEFAYAFTAKLHPEGSIEKSLRLLYRENGESDWVLTLNASVRNEFIQSAIIHSFRDPQSQLRLTNYTWYGKLMKQLTESHGKHAELKEAQNRTKEVAESIFETAKETIQNSSLAVAFPNTEIFFQFNEDLKTEIYKDCKIYIDDGIKSPLSEKGSGIQSATIIGLFNLYVSEYNTKTSALLCVEEPELYLHPHARRVISDRLDDFLNGERNQVLLTTHSPEFIRTTQEDLNLILVRKNDHTSVAERINIKEYKDILLDNDHNEIFFADKVVICEGYDNYILRWIGAEKFPEKLDGNNISIITAGGKDAIPRLANLVLSLGIECYIFADFDFLLRDHDAVLAKKYDKKSRSNILNLTEKFFRQECISGSNAEKHLSGLQSYRSKLKTKYEEEFYRAKKITDFPEHEREPLKKTCSWLREHGVGILEGEIEDIVIDRDLLNNRNKLDLNSVFKINKAIKLDGKKISSLIDTTQIEEFLTKIF